MDTNVAGLNKVVCFVNDATYNGRTVLITDSVNSWTKTVSELSCVFLIPSMPAPAKRSYTVSLMNSEGTAAQYSRQIELGFGDSVKIGLYENDEPVTKGTIPLATSTRTGGVRINDTTSNGIYLSGNNITLRDATSSQKGGMKVASSTSYGVRMNGDTLQTYDASSTQSGCIKIGAGLQVSSGVASVKYADASNVGGIKIGSGLSISSGVASVNVSTGLEKYNGNVRLKSISRADYYHNESDTINPGFVKFSAITVTDSTFYNRMCYGTVEGIDTDKTILIGVTEIDYTTGNKITIHYWMYNPYNDPQSISQIRISYCYWS